VFINFIHIESFLGTILFILSFSNSKLEITCRQVYSLILAVIWVVKIPFRHHTLSSIISIRFLLWSASLILIEILRFLLSIACIHLIEATIVTIAVRSKLLLFPKRWGGTFITSHRTWRIVVSWLFLSIIIFTIIIVLLKPLLCSLDVSKQCTGVIQQFKCLVSRCKFCIALLLLLSWEFGEKFNILLVRIFQNAWGYSIVFMRILLLESLLCE